MANTSSRNERDIPQGWIFSFQRAAGRCEAAGGALQDWKGDKVFISDGKIGEITQKLYDTMTGIQWGKIPDTKGWMVPVCQG